MTYTDIFPHFPDIELGNSGDQAPEVKGTVQLESQEIKKGIGRWLSNLGLDISNYDSGEKCTDEEYDMETQAIIAGMQQSVGYSVNL